MKKKGSRNLAVRANGRKISKRKNSKLGLPSKQHSQLKKSGLDGISDSLTLGLSNVGGYWKKMARGFQNLFHKKDSALNRSESQKKVA